MKSLKSLKTKAERLKHLQDAQLMCSYVPFVVKGGGKVGSFEEKESVKSIYQCNHPPKA